MLSSRNLLMLAGLGALLATVVLFAGVVTHSGGGALPAAEAAPDTSTSTTATSPASSSATTTTTTTGAAGAQFTTDTRGFVNTKAYCDDGQSAAAFGRTQRSLVVICVDSQGDYEYRGVRVSDGAGLKTAAKSTADGFEADTDDAVYTVSPTELVVTSGGKVIYRDTWISYQQQPRFTTETSGTTTPTSTSATATTTTSATSAPSSTTSTSTTTSRPAG
jgi:hypothetical protein